MAKKKGKAEKLFPDVLKLLEDGKSLRAACIELDLGKSTFFEFMEEGTKEEKDKKADQYARAKELGDEKEFDEIQEIADNVKPNQGDVAKARLQIDARKWRLGKKRPKKYGDKVDLSLGDGVEKVNITLNLGGDQGDEE